MKVKEEREMKTSNCEIESTSEEVKVKKPKN